MKVIENFETFPESINTPSSYQRFRSYDHCKLGVLLKIISGQMYCLDKLDFKATSKGNMDKLRTPKS
jgi:hypothetical protein